MMQFRSFGILSYKDSRSCCARWLECGSLVVHPPALKESYEVKKLFLVPPVSILLTVSVIDNSVFVQITSVVFVTIAVVVIVTRVTRILCPPQTPVLFASIIINDSVIHLVLLLFVLL